MMKLMMIMIMMIMTDSDDGDDDDRDNKPDAQTLVKTMPTCFCHNKIFSSKASK